MKCFTDVLCSKWEEEEEEEEEEYFVEIFHEECLVTDMDNVQH
jgi:hypothetical protein